MKRVVIILISLILNSCQSQEKKESSMDIEERILNLKKYTEEPIYQIRIVTPFSFAIYVNGIPVANKNVNYLTNYLLEINSAIPESGIQDIEFIIYPIYLNESKQKELLENDIEFNLTIEKTHWENGVLKDPEIISSYSLPKNDYSKLKEYKDSIKFEAIVPYKLENWKIGKILKESDSIFLKNNALKIYNTLQNNFENQKGKDYLNILDKGLFNLYQSNYFDINEAKNHIQHRLSFINKQKRELLSIENYKVEISQDGRLVSLRRNDSYNKGEGVLRRHYKKGRLVLVQVDDVILYMPKDKENLEVIWHSSLTKGANP